MLTLVHPIRRAEIYHSDTSSIRVDMERFYCDDSDSIEQCVKAQAGGIVSYNTRGSRFVVNPSLDSTSLIVNKSFSQRWVFINKTSKPISLIDRTGIPTRVPVDPRRLVHDHMLTLRKEMYFSSGVEADAVVEDMKRMGEMYSKELQLVALQFSRRHNTSSWVNCIYIEYHIKEEEIEAMGGLLYHYNSDYLISSNSVGKDTVHPYSAEHILPPHVPTSYKAGIHDLTTCFRFISDNPHERPKYIAIGGLLLKLTPQIGQPERLVSAESGGWEGHTRYIEYLFPESARVHSTAAPGRMQCLRVPLTKDASGLAIYDSLEEAQSSITEADKAKAKLNKKIEELEIELSKTRRDAEDKILQLNKEIRDKNEEISELKKKKHIETETIQGEREAQAHSKKMHSETFKIIAGIVGAFLALIPVVIKALSAIPV